METKKFSIVAPKIFDKPFSEAEILGSLVYLWSKLDYYKDISIESALRLLIPTVQSKQFVLFTKNNQPIAYVVWAAMNEETEKCYLSNAIPDPFIGCNNGDRIWLLSLFAIDDLKNVTDLLRKEVFPDKHVKAFYHKGGKKHEEKLLDFYGINFKKTYSRVD